MYLIILGLIIFFVIRHIKSKSTKKQSDIPHKTASAQEFNQQFEQLICFVNFAKKIKPLTGGNSGIYISYRAPKQEEYTSRLYAEFRFYDFNEVRFARRYACRSDAGMVKFYYNNISERAGLTRADWPYGIGESEFSEVLLGTTINSYFTLTSEDDYDEMFAFKVMGGIDSRNASQVANTITNILKTHFPELQVKNNHSTPYSMGISIQI